MDKTALMNCYDTNKDKNNSEMRTRYMWKYAASIGVSGTPFYYVNGVLLNTVPETAY